MAIPRSELEDIRPGAITKEQSRFLENHAEYNGLAIVSCLNLAKRLKESQKIKDSRLAVIGGPISGSRIKLVADYIDNKLIAELESLSQLPLTEAQVHERCLARAVLAFEQLEQELRTPGLFEDLLLAGGPAYEFGGDVLKPEPYDLSASITIPRIRGTSYKQSYTLPVVLNLKPD